MTRIAVIAIIVTNPDSVEKLNEELHEFRRSTSRIKTIYYWKAWSTLQRKKFKYYFCSLGCSYGYY